MRPGDRRPGGWPEIAPEPFGPLLARLRLARGWSQRQLAERLCAAAGEATVSRHEVSRWERQLRVPGDFWLGWLATVLEVPRPRLTLAATATRGGPDRDGTGAPDRLGRARRRLLEFAHAWLVDPTGPRRADGGTPLDVPPALPGEPVAPWGGNARAGVPAPFGGLLPVDGSPPTGGPPQIRELAGVNPADDAGRIDSILAGLRRLDDLVGGTDLAGPVHRWFRRLVAALPPAGPARRRLLPRVAEAGQLAGWLAADAGHAAAALEAYRLALTAAAAAGDRPLAGYVLASASQLLTSSGDPAGGLLLARTGRAGARRDARPALRALLWHRVALAAAGCHRPDEARAALDRAERAAQRCGQVGAEPAWAYWIDQPELAAMTGRCLTALGRPLRAAPLLSAARDRAGQLRGAAVYGAWLARAWLDLGEPEQACGIADRALLDAVATGSVRAAGELAALGRRLRPHHAVPAVRRHLALATTAGRLLPACIASGTPRDQARDCRVAPAPGWARD